MFNFNRRIFSILFIFLALFVCFGCVAATDVVSDDSRLSAPIVDDHSDFTMSARYNGGTGYHWVVSDDSYGVELVSSDNVIDHPGMTGSSATAYFTFHVVDDDYQAKLLLITPTGDVAKVLTSDMLN